MGQSVQVNGEEIARPESDSSFTSSDSEMEYQAAGNESDDNIQVIRRYEMPANEQILYNSGPRQVRINKVLSELVQPISKKGGRLHGLITVIWNYILELMLFNISSWKKLTL